MIQMNLKELKSISEPIPFVTGFLCGVICTLFALMMFWVIFKPQLRTTNIFELASVDGTSPTIVIMPIDVVELTKAVFSGLAALFSAVAVGYAMYSAARAKRAEIATIIAHQTLSSLSSNVAQLEKNTNSLTDRLVSSALKEDITSGIEKRQASD